MKNLMQAVKFTVNVSQRASRSTYFANLFACPKSISRSIAHSIAQQASAVQNTILRYRLDKYLKHVGVFFSHRLTSATPTISRPYLPTRSIMLDKTPSFVTSPTLHSSKSTSSLPFRTSPRPLHITCCVPQNTPSATLGQRERIAEGGGQERVTGGGRAPTSEDFSRYDGLNKQQFERLASEPGVRMVPLWRKVFSDLLTPVKAYRCLVDASDLAVPSFLLESVHTGERIGRYSFIGARPVKEVLAYGMSVTVIHHECGRSNEEKMMCDDPWDLIRQMNEDMKPAGPDCLPGGESLFCGGWVGYGGYDTMRYAELKSLPFSAAPNDDRGLPDLHLGLYRDVIVFDHVKKVIHVIHWVDLTEHAYGSTAERLERAYTHGVKKLEETTELMMNGAPLSPIAQGEVTLNTGAGSKKNYPSNMSKEEFMEALKKVRHHIMVGDAFQVVFSQRFERWSEADPFSVYRALRIINPSPYMIYMQCRGSVLVASSPEILTQVEDGKLTNRPLAGTRRRGATEEEDEELARELLADSKDRSEHMMLVDLGRNDVGKVSEYGSVMPEQIMKVEKYSHVMHISSTVTGRLRKGLTSWDALRATLPAGTISGAPKIRAMQIIDDIEPTKRGPYGGGIGYVSFHDAMNMALALRTMVVPTEGQKRDGHKTEWQYFVQAGAGIVYESDPEAEYTETVNKAMALTRAIDLAETAFEN